ncbi:MAG: nicotinate (nicotinamide) nucleotide adenylyltransferase [Sandaracinaceae bacterium]
MATTWAVFGGSFDPPHVGHVLAAAYVLSTAPVERVLCIPTFQHAFGKRSAPFPHRRRMCELAFGPLRGVEVSDLEARLGGASYTVRTLRELAARHPAVGLRLVVGADLVPEVPSWREGDRLPGLAPLLVVGRAGHGSPGDGRPLMPEVSSTEVRQRLEAGAEVEGLVPRSVTRYILRHGLYRGE